jgi:homogentisate 1,2-dioxygenase
MAGTSSCPNVARWGPTGWPTHGHFQAPAAWYEDKLVPDFRVVAKLGGQLSEASQDHSPFDVVAWHGNHLPYRYDLADFSPWAASTSTIPIRRSTPCCRPRSTSPGRTPWT